MAETTLPKRTRGRPRSAAGPKDTGTVQALERGILLLKSLSQGQSMTLTDLALQIGMPPSSAYRLLSTMQAQGIVDFDDNTQEWQIGVEAFRIGSSFLKNTNLLEASRDIMRRLMETTGETANLAVGDAGDVVFVGQIETHQPIRAFFRPGTRSPMHVSGIGKALMAEMPRTTVEKILQRKGLQQRTAKTLTSPDELFQDLARIHERGWSLDDEEGTEGMRCVAAPIFNHHGEAIAGISVSGPTVRVTDDALPDLGRLVREAAAEVTQTLAGQPPKASA